MSHPKQINNVIALFLDTSPILCNKVLQRKTIMTATDHWEETMQVPPSSSNEATIQ